MPPTCDVHTIVDSDKQGRGLTFSGQSASGEARQHNGNVYNNTHYRYTVAKRRSDETLREDRLNDELLRAAGEGQTARVRHLLDLQADFDCRDKHDLTPLHHAVLSGFEDVAELLLQRGADVNSPSMDCGSPLCLAVLKERSNLVSLLLRHRAKLDAKNENVGTALHCAAWAGSLEIAQSLLKFACAKKLNINIHFNASVRDHYLNAISQWNGDTFLNESLATLPQAHFECTPLPIAALYGNLKVLDLFCVGQAPVNKEIQLIADPEQEERNVSEIVTVLRSLGAGDRPSIRPLMAAVSTNRAGVVDLLLEHGAEKDHQDECGYTALMCAAHTGALEPMKVLLSHGASTAASSDHHRTALSYAAEKGHYACVNYLLGHYADTKTADMLGHTALWFAVAGAHIECLRLLLDAGAEVDCRANDGSTPLLTAIERGNIQSARILLGHGASTSVRAVDGTSIVRLILQQSSQRGRETFLKELLALLVDDHKVGNDFESAIFGAESPIVASPLTSKELCALQHFAGSLEPNLVQDFVTLGGNIDMANPHGRTALHDAASRGNLRAVKRLLESGAKVDHEDGTQLQQTSALGPAVIKGHLDIVQALLHYRASPNGFIKSLPDP